MLPKQDIPVTMTIAGSDSGGGAGIQADLKTFEAMGVFGTSVITALTAQNTQVVKSVHLTPPEMIEDQYFAVWNDLNVRAIKIGMLGTPAIVKTVSKILRASNAKNLILDPVMIAKGGDQLLSDDSIQVLVEELFPIADLITPNIPEAEILTGSRIRTREDMEQAARDLVKKTKRVLLKGGHLETSDVVSDILLTQDGIESWLIHPRIPSKNTHGTGCTYAAAVTAFTALGDSWLEAVTHARDYIQGAIASSAHWSIGKGHGPVDHHWRHRHAST